MKLAYIQMLAESLCCEMQPCCERIEIAGSIRRQCPECKDIEIVVIPRFEEYDGPANLFETQTIRTNTLRVWADNEAPLHWEKRGDKYWRGWWETHQIAVDIFLCTPENWGYIFMLRTGCAEYMHKVVTHARRIGKPFDKGRLWVSDIPVETREEIDVFKALDLAYAKPEYRHSTAPLKIKSARKAKSQNEIKGGWNGDNESPAAQRDARKEASGGNLEAAR